MPILSIWQSKDILECSYIKKKVFYLQIIVKVKIKTALTEKNCMKLYFLVIAVLMQDLFS